MLGRLLTFRNRKHSFWLVLVHIIVNLSMISLVARAIVLVHIKNIYIKFTYSYTVIHSHDHFVNSVLKSNL